LGRPENNEINTADQRILHSPEGGENNKNGCVPRMASPVRLPEQLG